MAHRLMEGARSARITGSAGALVLVIAFVMMLLSAPSQQKALGYSGSPAYPSRVIVTAVQAPR